MSKDITDPSIVYIDLSNGSTDTLSFFCSDCAVFGTTSYIGGIDGGYLGVTDMPGASYGTVYNKMAIGYDAFVISKAYTPVLYGDTYILYNNDPMYKYSVSNNYLATNGSNKGASYVEFATPRIVGSSGKSAYYFTLKPIIKASSSDNYVRYGDTLQIVTTTDNELGPGYTWYVSESNKGRIYYTNNINSAMKVGSMFQIRDENNVAVAQKYICNLTSGKCEPSYHNTKGAQIYTSCLDSCNVVPNPGPVDCLPSTSLAPQNMNSYIYFINSVPNSSDIFSTGFILKININETSIKSQARGFDNVETSIKSQARGFDNVETSMYAISKKGTRDTYLALTDNVWEATPFYFHATSSQTVGTYGKIGHSSTVSPGDPIRTIRSANPLAVYMSSSQTQTGGGSSNIVYATSRNIYHQPITSFSSISCTNSGASSDEALMFVDIPTAIPGDSTYDYLRYGDVITLTFDCGSFNNLVVDVNTPPYWFYPAVNCKSLTECKGSFIIEALGGILPQQQFKCNLSTAECCLSPQGASWDECQTSCCGCNGVICGEAPAGCPNTCNVCGTTGGCTCPPGTTCVNNTCTPSALVPMKNISTIPSGSGIQPSNIYYFSYRLDSPGNSSFAPWTSVSADYPWSEVQFDNIPNPTNSAISIYASIGNSDAVKMDIFYQIAGSTHSSQEDMESSGNNVRNGTTFWTSKSCTNVMLYYGVILVFLVIIFNWMC